MSEQKQTFEEWWKSKNIPTVSDSWCVAEMWEFVRGLAKEAWETAQGQNKPKRPFVIWWELELCYKLWHRKSVTIMSLGQSEHAERGYAEKAAKEKGQKWLDENFKKEEVQNWEVRVRPAKK